MKKVILVMFFVTIAMATITKAQETVLVNNSNETVKSQLSDSALMKMSIFDFCKEFGIPAEYNKRYETIIFPLCDAGIYLFNAQNNPYCENIDEKSVLGNRREICYCYVGNAIQNEILKRNILANRSLIKNGHLSIENAKKWKAVK